MTQEEFNVYIKRFPKMVQQALDNDRYKGDIVLQDIKDNFQPVTVYRAVKNQGKLDNDDFLSNFEYGLKYGKISSNNIAKNIAKNKIWEIGWFAVSVNENIEELKTALKFPSERYKGIAKGLMIKESGLADFRENTTHHNWYIFKDKKDDIINYFKNII